MASTMLRFLSAYLAVALLLIGPIVALALIAPKSVDPEGTAYLAFFVGWVVLPGLFLGMLAAGYLVRQIEGLSNPASWLTVSLMAAVITFLMCLMMNALFPGFWLGDPLALAILGSVGFLGGTVLHVFMPAVRKAL